MYYTKKVVKNTITIFTEKLPFFRQINISTKEVTKELISRKFLSVIAFYRDFERPDFRYNPSIFRIGTCVLYVGIYKILNDESHQSLCLLLCSTYFIVFDRRVHTCMCSVSLHKYFHELSTTPWANTNIGTFLLTTSY